MKLHFPPGQNYDCVCCARSCTHSWRIHVDPITVDRIRESPVALRVIQETGVEQVIVRDPADDSQVLARHDGHCVFLNSEKLCSLHAELGVEVKPVGCRQFPFQLALTPDGVFVGISFFCTAAQQNAGRPISVHEQDLRELLRLFRPTTLEGPFPVTAVTGATLEWPAYRRLEGLLEQDLAAGRGSARALWALSELAGFAPAGPIPEQAVEVAFQRARPELLSHEPALAQMGAFFVTSLFVSIEVPSERAQAVTEGLLTGQAESLSRSGWEGTLDELEALVRPLPPRAQEARKNYLAALVFRKFLPAKRPVLDNLVLLYLGETLFGLYVALGMARRGATACEEADIHFALDAMELELMTHMTSAGVDRMLSAFAQAYVEQTQAA